MIWIGHKHDAGRRTGTDLSRSLIAQLNDCYNYLARATEDADAEGEVSLFTMVLYSVTGANLMELGWVNNKSVGGGNVALYQLTCEKMLAAALKVNY